MLFNKKESSILLLKIIYYYYILKEPIVHSHVPIKMTPIRTVLSCASPYLTH